MTRIIGGVAGGRRLRTPPGEATRPTAERVREALFSSLEAGGGLAGLVVLDLYAGSGALGLEARSRGAARVVLVEHDRRTAELVRANARALGLDGVRVVAAPVGRFLAGETSARFDLVLADPPYDLAPDRLSAVLARLVAGGWLAGDAQVVVERSRRGQPPTWPEGIGASRERAYGETVLWYGRATPRA